MQMYNKTHALFSKRELLLSSGLIRHDAHPQADACIVTAIRPQMILFNLLTFCLTFNEIVQEGTLD